MVEPTEKNLALYEQWMMNTSAGDSPFFGSLVGKCSRIELLAGDTFIIPSGAFFGFDLLHKLTFSRPHRLATYDLFRYGTFLPRLSGNY